MTDTPRSLADWVMEYARHGIPVLPLSGKLPRIPKRAGGSGVHDATTDLDQVRAWWRRWPHANIGLRCGIRFDVIDVDGPEGRQSLERFLADHAHGPIGGPRVLTGSGGWHLYVTPTQLPDRIGVLDHVDYRAADRYVVAPPSRHPQTHRPYTWVAGRGIDTPLGQVPAALLERLAPPRIETAAPAPTIRPAAPSNPRDRSACPSHAGSRCPQAIPRPCPSRPRPHLPTTGPRSRVSSWDLGGAVSGFRISVFPTSGWSDSGGRWSSARR